MKIDFHTHTHHSYDCNMKPERIIHLAMQRELDAIVINDHNTIKGGLECQRINKHKELQIITGAEIKTDIGDVTGIFLKEEITSVSFPDVVQEIKRQGGIVILNHPYVGHKLEGLNFTAIDLIEGYNGRCTPEQNKKACLLAHQHKIPIIAGSDAHTYSEIANCYTQIENNDFLNPISTHYTQCSKWAPIRSQFVKSFKTKNAELFVRLTLKSIRTVFKSQN